MLSLSLALPRGATADEVEPAQLQPVEIELTEEEPAPDEEDPTERRRPRRLQQQQAAPAAPAACPDGQIHDLGVCANAMSNEDTWRCGDALRLAGLAPEAQLPSLYVTGCTSVPLPDACAIPSQTPGDCLSALCEDSADDNRPAICNIEPLAEVVSENVRCHYDAFAAVSWAVREYAPDADPAVAEAAAMRSMSAFIAESADSYADQAERRLESAVGSRMAMSSFLAYRLLLCGPI